MTAINIDSAVNIKTHVFNVPTAAFSGEKVTKYSIINNDPKIPAINTGSLDFNMFDISFISLEGNYWF